MRDPEIPQAIATALQLVLGLVFALSAVPKLRHPREFLATVRSFEIGPPPLSAPAAVIVIALEATLAILFLTGLLLLPALLTALALTSVFVAGSAINLARGRKIACGCFGSSDEPVSPRSLLRLALLMSALVALGVGVLSAEVEATSPGMLLNEPGPSYLVDVAGIAGFLMIASIWLLDRRQLRFALGFRRAV